MKTLKYTPSSDLIAIAACFENINRGLFILNVSFVVEYMSLSYTNITGVLTSDVLKKPFEDIIEQTKNPVVFEEIVADIGCSGAWHGEVWLRGKTGDALIEMSIAEDLNSIGSGIQYMGVFSDITAKRSTEEELIKLANYDALTGLPNRTLFGERIQQAIVGKRDCSPRFAVLFIDLDNFKRVNDSLGHDLGDKILIEVAQRIKRLQRAEDLVARLGGDEFIMVIEELGDLTYAAKMAKRLIDGLEIPIAIKGHKFTITSSIGIAVFPEDGKTLSELVRHADHAMYAAKNNGKNNYTFFSNMMNANAHRRLSFESNLRKAIADNGITIEYKPKVNLLTGVWAGLEVRALWELEGAWIPPEVFIPVAEETGLIAPLSDFVLKTASDRFRRWLDAGLISGKLSLNLSERQFLLDDLVSRIDNILHEVGLSAQYVELKITEGTILHDSKRALQLMRGFKSKGISLAISDFGSYCSFLTRLKQFPVDTVVIAQSLIMKMPFSPQYKAIVAHIINLAQTFDLHVVSEGAETQLQGIVMDKMKAEDVQGFLFSNPMPAEQLELLLIQRKQDRDKLT